MKLSESILKGCELVPKQGFGKLVSYGAGQPVSACVWGAAAIGVVGLPSIGESKVEYNMALGMAMDQLAKELGYEKCFRRDNLTIGQRMIAMNDGEEQVIKRWFRPNKIKRNSTMTREAIAEKLHEEGY